MSKKGLSQVELHGVGLTDGKCTLVNRLCTIATVVGIVSTILFIAIMIGVVCTS